MAFNRGSRARLTHRTAERFASERLFDRIARTICFAECLPRKELFESWEVARRVRRMFRGGPVVELAAGHGLLAHLMLILDDTSETATCVDIRRPQSANRLGAALTERWPRLANRIEYVEADLDTVAIPPGAIIVSQHACGCLTDRVLDRAIECQARVAVLPCCHDLRACDTGHLDGWLPGPVAVDVVRAERLRAAGFKTHTATIPADITPQNRLLLGEPQARPAGGVRA